GGGGVCAASRVPAVLAAMRWGRGATMRSGRMMLAALALVVAASTTFAADEEPAPGWQFEFMPYVWAPGAFGTVAIKGRTAHVHTTLGGGVALLCHGDALALDWFVARALRQLALM